MTVPQTRELITHDFGLATVYDDFHQLCNHPSHNRVEAVT